MTLTQRDASCDFFVLVFKVTPSPSLLCEMSTFSVHPYVPQGDVLFSTGQILHRNA